MVTLSSLKIHRLVVEEHVGEHLALRTQHSYRQMSERISKALGHIQLNKLKAHHIRHFLQGAQRRGHSP
jgi:ABC-type oligopeptide transport system ATPase subunit